jgi:hypothetical protein
VLDKSALYSTKTVIPDVVVSCDSADHGESQIIDTPVLVVEEGEDIRE